MSDLAEAINQLRDLSHQANRKWWLDLETLEFNPDRNVGEMLMLAVTELAEAMEGDRKNLMDSHLPHRPQLEVELADCLIRIFDTAGGLGLDLGGAFAEKMEYNSKRYDHSIEARRAAGGKKV